jgi:serine/threonine protein kinase
VSHSVADARYFGNPIFAARLAELRRFAAKIFRAVENHRERVPAFLGRAWDRRDAERLKRFQQEAHAVVALNHPNILTGYEIGEDHSTHYIASELIEGETLRQRLMRGRMELSGSG